MCVCMNMESKLLGKRVIDPKIIRDILVNMGIWGDVTDVMVE